jgi:hypothetical protein
MVAQIHRRNVYIVKPSRRRRGTGSQAVAFLSPSGCLPRATFHSPATVVETVAIVAKKDGAAKRLAEWIAVQRSIKREPIIRAALIKDLLGRPIDFDSAHYRGERALAALSAVGGNEALRAAFASKPRSIAPSIGRG